MSPPLPVTAGQATPAGASAAAEAKPSASASLPPAVAETGTVKLAISPWGQVLVDGREVGVAPPLNQLNLPVGRHVITIRNGDAPDFRQTVEVRSGKTAHVKHQF